MKDFYQECDFCGKRQDNGNSSKDWFNVDSQETSTYNRKDMCPECHARLVTAGAKHSHK